jgi:VCBS repeat protein
MHTTLIKATVRGALVALLALTFTPLLAPGIGNTQPQEHTQTAPQIGLNKYDFNGDGHPDLVLVGSGGQTAVWYLNNNVLVGGAYGPTLPLPWIIFDTADFNGDAHPDYVLYNLGTNQTAIWYLNNNVLVGGAYGPTIPHLPFAWDLVGIGDFNGDGHPDYVLFNFDTHQTAIWYLNNNVLVGGAFGPTLPPDSPNNHWSIFGIADFNGDGHPDYVLFNIDTSHTAIWYLNNNVLVGGAYGPTIPNGWAPVHIADFNGDGHPDYLLQNSTTRQTAIWYLNNNVLVGGAYGPSYPPSWRP